MPKNEIKKSIFPYAKLGKTSHITLTYSVVAGAMKYLSKFECDGPLECGVGKEEHSGVWSYDWSKCIHPNARTNP